MRMRTWIWRWVRLLLAGGLLFGATGADCLTDALREASEELNSNTKRIVWLALWLSGSEQANNLLKAKKAKVSGDDKKYIELLINKKTFNMFDKPISSPADLDMLWAAFMASGDRRCVERVIGVLPWHEDKKDTDRFLIGHAAKWSLTSNARQHRQVMQLCQEELKKLSGAHRSILEEVINKARGTEEQDDDKMETTDTLREIKGKAKEKGISYTIQR